MVKSKIALFVCVLDVLAVSQAYSAPSVKKLGGVGVVAGINSVPSAKTDTTKISSPVVGRAGTIRSVKTVNTPVAVSTKTVASTNSASTARLSVGKYLHNAGTNAGLIKPVATSNTTINNAEFEEVENQVTNLTNRIEILENGSNINVVENDEHVDANKMVSGIDVDTDGKTLRVSRSNVKIPVGSENASPTASIWVDE